MQSPEHNSTIKVTKSSGWLTAGDVYHCEYMIVSNDPILVLTNIKNGVQYHMQAWEDHAVSFRYSYVQPNGFPLPLLTRIINFFR